MSRARALLALPRRAGEAVLDNPILLRELQGALRQRRYVLILTLALLALGLALCATLWGLISPDLDMSQVGRQTFLLLAGLMLLLVLMVFPSFAATAVVDERTQKSLDMLLTSRLSAGEIALGKLLGALVTGVAFLAATAPLAALTSLFGGVTPGQVALAYAVLLVVAVCVTAYALLVSTLTSTAAQAVTRTYMVLPGLAALTAGPLLVVALPELLGESIRPSSLLPRALTVILPAGATAGALASAAVWALGWASLFWILATLRLAPPGADRAFLPRVWCLAVAAVALVLLLLDGQGQLPAQRAAELAARVIMVDLTAGTAMLLALAVRDPDHRPHGAPPVGLRGLLAPGAERGAAFVFALHALTLLAVGGLALSWLELPAAGGYRPPAAIVGWGALYSSGWLLALGAALVLGGRLSSDPRRGRNAVLAGVAVATLWPSVWLVVDSSSAACPLWKGHPLSPVSVCASLLHQPLRGDERQLVVGGPSWGEIVASLDAYEPEVQRLVAGLPQQEALRRRRELLDARERTLRALGVPVHRLGALLAWVAAALLLLGLAWQARGGPARRVLPAERDSGLLSP